MKSTHRLVICCVALLNASPLAAEPAPTGPAAEKRFPPLKIPPGFKATLYACDPFIEYPSVIANGPKNGSIFVGVDYMTGLGTEIIRRSEVRLLEDTDGDGYADKSTVYAKEFGSIQGLAYHDGAVYVMHAPLGADHGYPYHYYERPDEALPPLGDFGLGSSAGGLCYRETQFPPEYRGNLFNCEWGRSIVRSPLQRQGSGFAPVKEIEFASGAEDDPYGFKPTDLVVDYDGAMFVSDWADGQRPKRGRGRIYRITYVSEKNTPSKAELKKDIEKLNSESYFERFAAQDAIIHRKGGREEMHYGFTDLERPLNGLGRSHGIWVLTHLSLPILPTQFSKLAAMDSDLRVRVQAIRALADLKDPVLLKHRLDAGPGDPQWAETISAIAEGETKNGKDHGVFLEAVIALGRLRWADTPEWLQKNITKPDVTLAHASMMTLRRLDNWPAVLKLLALPDAEPMRAIALRAIAEQHVPEIADGLIERLKTEKDAGRRREYADLLTRIYKKPGEWVYWGYRPPPRPANTVAWEKTPAIETMLNSLFNEDDPITRLAVARRMQREKVPVKLPSLTKWLREESEAEPLLVMLELLRDHPADSTREFLASAVSEKTKPAAVRLAALKQFSDGLDGKSKEQLLTLAKALEHGPVLAEALRLLVKRPKLDSAKLMVDRVASYNELVRAAAVDGIGDLKIAEGA